MSQGVVKVIAQGPTGPAGAGSGGTIPVTQGGTGATTAAGARTNLGVDAAGTASSAVAAHASGTGVHSIAGVTGLQDALDAKETSGTASTAVAAHAAAADPHPGYRLESDTTDAISEGSTNLFHTAARVRAAVLTGLSVATNAAIEAADTVIAALGKLQAQITAVLSTLNSHTGDTSNPHSTTAGQVGAIPTGGLKTVNGSTLEGSGNINATETIALACSDETTDLTAGTAKVTFRMPYSFTLSAVRASVTTAPTGSALTVDINEGGTSILSTKLTIDADEKTSTTAATPAVISDSALADDAEITIDIDSIGSSVAGAGLKVYLIGQRA